MNKTYVVAFNRQTFNPGGNESAILRIKDYNLPDIIFQRLPVRKKLENKEVSRMRKCNIINTLTSVDSQEFVRIGRKWIENYEGVIY